MFALVFFVRPGAAALQKQPRKAISVMHCTPRWPPRIAGILRGDFAEEDTVVVEAPGGEQATGLTVYRKGGNGAGPAIDVQANPVELTP